LKREFAGEIKKQKITAMEKKLILIFLLANSIFANSQDKFCDPSLADVANKYILKKGGEWLKDFNIYLPRASSSGVNPVASYKMVLSENTVYNLLLISSPKYKGDAQLTVEDNNGNIIATFKTKTKNIPEVSEISIKTTDTYTIKINFTDQNEGCALFTLYFLKKI